jgi:hypothetical protein
VFQDENHLISCGAGDGLVFLSILIMYFYLILPATLGPGVYSASNKNEYQKQKNNVSGE